MWPYDPFQKSVQTSNQPFEEVLRSVGHPFHVARRNPGENNQAYRHDPGDYHGVRDRETERPCDLDSLLRQAVLFAVRIGRGEEAGACQSEKRDEEQASVDRNSHDSRLLRDQAPAALRAEDHAVSSFFEMQTEGGPM